MLTVLKKTALLDILLIALVTNLVISRASWPSAFVAVFILAAKQVSSYLSSIKEKANDKTLESRMSSIESRLTLIGLKK